MLPGLAPASIAMSRIETALKPWVENNSSAALRMASRMFGFRVIRFTFRSFAPSLCTAVQNIGSSQQKHHGAERPTLNTCPARSVWQTAEGPPTFAGSFPRMEPAGNKIAPNNCVGGRCRGDVLFSQLRKDCDDVLLAVDDLSQETRAIDVAILVPTGFHQNSGRSIRLQRQSFHGKGKCLAIEPADLPGDVFDKIHRDVTLDAVVVRRIFKARVELGCKFLNGRNRRIRRQTDMTADAVCRKADEIDHLLAEQRGFTEKRGTEALALGLQQEARAFLLVAIDKDRIGLDRFQPGNVGGKVDLTLLGGEVGNDLDAARLHLLDKTVMAAFAEIIVHPDHRDGFGLQPVVQI